MKAKLFLRLYSSLSLLAAFVLGPFFLIHKRGRRRLLERYGFIDIKKTETEFIWLHAASLGELKGLEPILDYLSSKSKIIFSSISVTALDYIKNSKYFEASFLIPFDSPIFYRNIFGKCKIKAFIFAETEIWPVLIDELNSRGTPCIMLNGKVLSSSFKIYSIFNSLFSDAFKKIALICAANELSLKRFDEFSARNVILTGNMKYVQKSLPNKDISYEEIFSNKRQTFVVGSVRKGEEQIIFPVLKKLTEEQSFWNIIIAPRQLEDASYFSNKLAALDLDFKLRSDKEILAQENEGHSILLLDTIGELLSFYNLADLVFIGGSLVSGYGGHNPLEAAQFAKIITLGTNIENIIDIIELSPEVFIYIKSSEDLYNLMLTFKAEDYAEKAQKGLELSQRFDSIPSQVIAKLDKYL